MTYFFRSIESALINLYLKVEPKFLDELTLVAIAN